MLASEFLDLLPCGFFCGVPDSLLSALCAEIMRRHGVGHRHVIAANEGNAVGLAAGYHLATGEVPCVYLQNSGVGNIINPVTSLLSPDVYGIPCVFVVGWRGEPGVHDEPQHAFMGKATVALLQAAGVETRVIVKDTARADAEAAMAAFSPLLAQGQSVAFVIRKGAITGAAYAPAASSARLTRERAVERVLIAANDDPIVSTTGKASRELFELRERLGYGHERDFLTVGSMGHCSSIALGLALAKPAQTVFCLDGDGAALMHLGAMAVIGAQKPHNLIHIVLNNAAHESVGGMPTVGDSVDLAAIAKDCGYGFTASVSDAAALDETLNRARRLQTLSFVEARCAVGARDDLGRPTTTPKENKLAFMQKLRGGR